MTQSSTFLSWQLRNRKRAPCFCRVIETRVEVWENEKCCGNTGRRRVFPRLFLVPPNFHECFYNSIETRRTCSLFLLENTATKHGNRNVILQAIAPTTRDFESQWESFNFNMASAVHKPLFVVPLRPLQRLISTPFGSFLSSSRSQ